MSLFEFGRVDEIMVALTVGLFSGNWGFGLDFFFKQDKSKYYSITKLFDI